MLYIVLLQVIPPSAIELNINPTACYLWNRTHTIKLSKTLLHPKICTCLDALSRSF